jgi:hypothetical protein
MNEPHGPPQGVKVVACARERLPRGFRSAGLGAPDTPRRPSCGLRLGHISRGAFALIARPCEVVLCKVWV